MKFANIILILLSLFLVSCSSQLTTEEYIQSGKAFLQKNEWKAAIIEFKNAVKQSPDNAQARALLGEAYLSTFNSNAAIKELKRAMDSGNDDGSLLLMLAKAYEQKQDYEIILSDINVKGTHEPSIKADIHALRAKAFLRKGKIKESKIELDLAQSIDESRTDVRLAWSLFEMLNGNVEAQKAWIKPLLERDGGVADAWSQMAQLEQSESNFDAAELAYSKAISLRNIVHLDYIKRALLRISQKQYKEANEDLAILKKAGVKWPMVGHAEGLLAFLQEKDDEAQSHFEQVLSNYPGFGPSQLLLGQIQFKKGNYQNAVKTFELYISTNSDNRQANLTYAASLMKLGKVKKSIPTLDKLDKQNPNNFRILSLLGSAFLQDMQLDKSISVLKKAVAIEPSNALARLQLAGALMRQKSGLVSAQQQLKKAIELDPELYKADLALYMSYIRSKKFSTAREVAENLRAKKLDSSLGGNLVGLSYLADKNKNQAILEFNKTLELFPNDPGTSNNLARIYVQDGDLAKAKKLYLSVLDKNPDDIKSINQLAIISAKENDQAAVIDWLKKAINIDPDSLSSKLLLATQYLAQKDASQAVQLLQNVKEKDKEQPNFILLMSKAKMGVGEYPHATRILKKLLSAQPDLSSAHFLLAQSYGFQNNKGKLRSELEETVRISPNHFSAHLMLARLELLEKNIDVFKRRISSMIKVYPDNKDVQFLNAKIESSEKGYDSAIETLTALMTETPHSEVVVDLARNHWVKGDRDSAISGLELWLENNQADKSALMLLAQYYLAENRQIEAKKTYEDLGKLLPDNPVVLNNLAWLMIETDVNQGIVYAKKALQITPRSPFIKDTLAMLLLKNGQHDEALSYSEDAAHSAPNAIDIIINYAKILSANGQKVNANDVLKKALDKTKNPKMRNVIQNELDKL